jgi:hypothetical protein
MPINRLTSNPHCSCPILYINDTSNTCHEMFVFLKLKRVLFKADFPYNQRTIQSLTQASAQFVLFQNIPQRPTKTKGHLTINDIHETVDNRRKSGSESGSRLKYKNILQKSNYHSKSILIIKFALWEYYD